MTITLGSKVKDKIDGFTGIAVGRAEFINGCVRIQIQPIKLKSDGMPNDLIWTDESQLQVLKQAKPSEKVTTGGPREDAQRRPDA